MVLGRGISAAFGTATIPLRLRGRRAPGRPARAGSLAAALLACAVLHLRESHFFSVDVSMTFFTVRRLAASRCGWPSAADARRPSRRGSRFGGAILCKYSGAFIARWSSRLAYLLSPRRPARGQPASAWIRMGRAGTRALRRRRGGVPGARPDDVDVLRQVQRRHLRTIVVEPLTGASRPIWTAQFADSVAHALLGHEHPLVQPRPGVRDRRRLPASSGSLVAAHEADVARRRVSDRRTSSRPGARSRRSSGTRCRSRPRWRSRPPCSASDLINRPRLRRAGPGPDDGGRRDPRRSTRSRT